MPTWGGNINTGIPNQQGLGPVPIYDPALDPNVLPAPAPNPVTPVNPVVPVIPDPGMGNNTSPVDPNTYWQNQIPVIVNPNGSTVVPNPVVPIIPTGSNSTVTPTTSTTINNPIPANLIFHSINDLTTTSNQPLVHSRDGAGNIVLINDTASNNQLLTIESLSYTLPNNKLQAVIDTQFNYFKFPPTFKTIEVSDELSLTDAVEEVDTISTRYTPSLTSGRQSGLGRPPILKAGFMIKEGVDDILVQQEPTGYYGRDNESLSILNMETVLAGTSQLKPSKFIITPDMIEAGEDILFKIRIDHYMNGNGQEIAVPHFPDPWNPARGSGENIFQARLNKVKGTSGNQQLVAMTGNYFPSAYIDPAGGTYNGNLRTRRTANLSAIRSSLNTYKIAIKSYDNLLATIGDRQTTQQRNQLVLAKNRIETAKINYDAAIETFKDTQERLVNALYQTPLVHEPGSVGAIYEMLYIVDITSARPYDEYWIETRCFTYSNVIGKEATYWDIRPISKINFG